MTIETAVRFVVRFVAVFILAAHWTYRAGVAAGRFVHWLNDWLTAASKAPLATATRLASAALAWAMAVIAEPEEPGLLEMLGAELLTDEQLEAEIAAYNEQVMPGIAEIFAANCAEMAASDARLYRQAGERIANIRSLLDEAESEPAPAPAKPKRVARRKPAAVRKAKAAG